MFEPNLRPSHIPKSEQTAPITNTDIDTTPTTMLFAFVSSTDKMIPRIKGTPLHNRSISSTMPIWISMYLAIPKILLAAIGISIKISLLMLMHNAQLTRRNGVDGFVRA